MNASQQNSNSSAPVTSSASDQDQKVNKFEKISPVLEIIYVMIKNIQKYLQVYAEDIKATSLSEYSSTYKALDEVKKTLDGIYNISDTTKAPAKGPVPAMPVVPLVPSAPVDNIAPSNMSITNSVPPVVPLTQNNIPLQSAVANAGIPVANPPVGVATDVSTPAQPVAVAPAVQNSMPVVGNQVPQQPPEDQKIDSILSELRAIREKSGDNN